jgi:ABC-2 type transport system permease protein/lipopolysaccharide transport system permease protein
MVAGLLRLRRSRTTCAVSSDVADPRAARFIERRSVAGRPLDGRDELRDTRAHAALLAELIHRDLTVRYKRSFLGFLWTMLHPLLLMLIFVVVFSSIFRGQSPHYETYFLSAYVAWNFFSQTVVNSMAAVAWNGPLMKRVRVPPSIFTLSIILSGLVNLGLSLIVLFSIMLVVGAPLHAALWFLPISLLIVGIFTFGVSLALTAVSVFFGDVREMVQAGLPALMYLTPIIYPLSIVPARFRWPIKLNPLVYIVEIVRDPVYYGIIPSPTTLMIAIVLAVGSMAIGWMIFRHLAPRFHAHL